LEVAVTRAARVATWWRVELSESGKVLKCSEAIEPPVKPGCASIFYVLAVDQAAAERAAFNAYCAANNRRRRARYDAEGKCRCGRPRDTEFKRCSACLALDREHDERYKARKRGETVPPRDRLAVDARRKQNEAQQARLAVLREVEQAWLEASTNKLFTAWLKREIEAITGRRVA
jgi:hypothetical protein